MFDLKFPTCLCIFRKYFSLFIIKNVLKLSLKVKAKTVDLHKINKKD